LILVGSFLAFGSSEVGLSVDAGSAFFTSPDTLAASVTPADPGALKGLASCGLISSLKGEPSSKV
jgi:hypothetical protein